MWMGSGSVLGSKWAEAPGLKLGSSGVLWSLVGRCAYCIPKIIKLPSLPILGEEGEKSLIKVVKKTEEGFTLAYHQMTFTKTIREK